MPPKKEEKKVDHFVEVMFVLLVLAILVMLWSGILQTLVISRFGSYTSIWMALTAFFLTYLWPIIIIFGILLALAALLGIIYNVRKLNELANKDKQIYGPTREEDKEVPVISKNAKWERVITHINSASSGDWRIAIIEADVMLDELLRAQGYHGDSLGEMLKGVEKSDMLTLDFAWEAHKVRNQIAHTGADYQLNEREAKHVITLYEAVFKEFKII